MYHYQAAVVQVIDGDTVDLDVDLGFGVVLSKQRFRLKGINAPEMKGASKEKGEAAKAHLSSLLLLQTLNKKIPVEIQTTVVKDTDTRDKYGRWLATVWIATPSGSMQNVNQAMIDAGHAVPFMV